MFEIKPNLKFEDYLKIDAISRSDLVAMRRGMNYYKYHKNDYTASSSLEFGQALHTLVLENERFKDVYTVAPDGLSLATKEGKAWKADNADKTIIKAKDYDTMLNMAASILSHPVAGPILGASRKELTVVWEMSDQKFKARYDSILIKDNVATIIDIKSTQNLSQRKLSYSIKDYGYDIQSVLYSLGALVSMDVEYVNFFFLWAEKRAPYDVLLSKIPYSMEVSVREEINSLLLDLKMARESDKWPSRQPLDVIELGTNLMELEEDNETDTLDTF